MSEYAEDKAKAVNRRNWVSLVPYGLNQQHPNNYRNILESVWGNRDSLGYALRILSWDEATTLIAAGLLQGV